MRYLFGDSTESDLEFDYLELLRAVFDCGVALLAAEATLAANRGRREAREGETSGLIRAVEELGNEARGLVEPVAKEQPGTPVGRTAAAIAAAVKEAVERESAAAKAAFATVRTEIEGEDNEALDRARSVLEKLLEHHDLPGAEKELEASWASGPAKVTMRQRTSYGLNVEIALEAAGGTFGADLRVERIAEGVEIHTHEAGGWLKKSDKLVAIKLARYQITNVAIAGGTVRIRLRGQPDASADLVLTITKAGEISVETTGGGAKEYAVEDRDRAGIQQLADKLEAAVRGLDHRTKLVAVDLDGKPLQEHGHPRVLIERLIAAIAPTVQKIAKHSRSGDELVLRRLVGDNRREEVFISVSELVRKLEPLAPAMRAVFTPLQLPGIDGLAPAAKRSGDTRPPPVTLKTPAPVEIKAETNSRDQATPVTTPVDKL